MLFAVVVSGVLVAIVAVLTKSSRASAVIAVPFTVIRPVAPAASVPRLSEIAPVPLPLHPLLQLQFTPLSCVGGRSESVTFWAGAGPLLP